MPPSITEASGVGSGATMPRTTLLTLLVALGSLALLAADWVNATFSLWNRSIPLAFEHIQSDPQGVCRLHLTTSIDPGRIFPSRIRLQDAKRTQFFYTPRANSLYVIGRGLFAIEKKNFLLITLPGAEKELSAKDGAVLSLPVLLPAWTINALLVLLCLSCAILLYRLPFPTRRWKVAVFRLLAFGRWCFQSIGRHPLVFLSLPSLYLLTLYPCLWKDRDALGQLIAPAGVGNIYHFPALYCFSARAVIWLGDQFSGVRPFDLLASQRPTLQGIYALVLFQNVGLVLSLGLLSRVLTNRRTLRGVFVVAICLASSVFSSVMLCGSEAWSLIATIAVFAFGLRLYRAQGTGLTNWIGYTLALLLAIGSRNINVLLGFWLVGVFLVAVLVSLCFGRQEGLPLRPLLKAAIALVVLLASILSNNLLELCLAKKVGVEPRTTLGRTLSDRIDSFLAKLGPAERTSLAEKLTAVTSNRNVRLAIEDQATVGSFYHGTNDVLERQLTEIGLRGEVLEAEKDRVILSATLSYLKTLHPVLIATIWADFLKGFTTTSNASLAIDPFAENSYIGTYRQQEPDQWASLDMLSSTFLPESVAWLDRSAHDAYIKGVNVKTLPHAKLASLLFLTIVLLGLCFWKRRGVYSHAMPAVFVLLTGVAEFAATMVCVFFLTRYALPMFVSMGIALFLLVDGCLETKQAARNP